MIFFFLWFFLKNFPRLSKNENRVFIKLLNFRSLINFRLLLVVYHNINESHITLKNTSIFYAIGSVINQKLNYFNLDVINYQNVLQYTNENQIKLPKSKLNVIYNTIESNFFPGKYRIFVS